MVNHLFNSAFNWLSSFPSNPISDFFSGALVLIRRSIGFIPTGVTATQVGTELSIAVNTGSVAYFRTQGSEIQVAGDPGFSAPQQFTASTVKSVAIGNSGNAGCAGFVFTEGTVDAGLTTAGIDSLNFGSTAVFTRAVSSTLTKGTLQLSNAVRGLGGVSLNGPIRLASNVEVDAGGGDATFAGTVDGKGWPGKQSLTVTALGTTTFDSAVGGKTALKSLTTRAITPLQVEQSADSKTVPLYFMPVETPNGTEVKYGIDVAIGNNAARRYLFDTGGNGFFAGYNPDYWKGVTLGTEPVDITYTSGGFFDGLATDTAITIGTGSQTVSTGRPVTVAAVTQAGNIFSGAPEQITNPYTSPGPFAGDFGAAFGVQMIGDNTAPPYLPGTFITSPLFQLPGNLSSGYLTQLGPTGTQPQLTVGVTDALRAQFPYAVKVSEVLLINGTSAGAYPISGYPLLQQFGIAPNYTVTGADGTTEQLGTGPLKTIIDNGAASTNVRLPDLPKPFQDADGNLKAGTTFTAVFPGTAGRPDLTWEFVAGNNSSVNLVGYSNISGAATTGPNVNAGVNIFNGYDVMFDVKEQIIWLRPNGGLSTVNLKSVTTKGDQTYSENAILGGTYTTGGGSFSVAGTTTMVANSVIEAGRGNVAFSGTVDGRIPNVQSALQINSRGATTFVRAVGGLVPLAGLTTDKHGTTTTAGVSTAGSQTYGDDVTLNGGYSVAAGTFSVAGSTTLAGPTSVSTTKAPISFGGTVDATTGNGPLLSVTATGSSVSFGGAVGGVNPLGGLLISDTATATAAGAVNLDGALTGSAATGLSIGEKTVAQFANGGTVAHFTGSGIVFRGNSTNSTISGFTIADNVYDGIQVAGGDYNGTLIAKNTIIGNAAFGIETLAGTNGLTISGNTIGATGTSNPWGYTTSGPNTHGIVLAAGNYAGTVITGNTITNNRRGGISAPGGVQGLQINGNTLSSNAGGGIEFATGDFSGTLITGNTISGNQSDGISLGAGIGQGVTTGGDPLNGYTDTTYEFGRYIVTYPNSPDFYDPAHPPADPQITMTVGTRKLQVNLDTGSRGLYFDQYQLDPNIVPADAPTGSVYLNSSNRLYFGNWVTQTITFDDSFYFGKNGPDTTRKAVSTVPVLVVSAIGASNTPPPGSTVPTTTFGTTIASGTVTITDGKDTAQAPIIANGQSGGGYVTIPGGWWANYADNLDPTSGKPILSPVANFGVGFDRSGIGTAPTANGENQAYNAFLNLTEMRDGSMRPGYIITAGGVQLGLDSSVSGYAYTDLTPTGLAQGTQTAADWQPATGSVTYGGEKYDSGPLVIDLGIPSGILTLPGQTPSTTFSGQMTVDMLNSKGAVGYDIDEKNNLNLLNPTAVAFFDPLAGAYTENMPPLSNQFFNTGRKVLAGFNYLYDAAGGYLGLSVADQKALDEAKGTFSAAHFSNPNQLTGVSNLVIQNNTISGNTGSGITVNGSSSTGNGIIGNSIFGNSGVGIALTNGGNDGQPTPVVSTAKLTGTSKITVSGIVTPSGSYSGVYQVQVFANPTSDAGNVQGRLLLGTFNTAAGSFTAQIDRGSTKLGDFITVTATPVTGALNTSELSAAAPVGQ